MLCKQRYNISRKPFVLNEENMTTPILTLTAAAQQRVQKILQKNTDNVLRIDIEKSGCSGWKYVVAVAPQAWSDDICITEQVYVAKAAVPYLQDSVLDCLEKEFGMWQWQFNNPQVKSSCGCGESVEFERK
jgi:iron-sulfur cluster assembly protein